MPNPLNHTYTALSVVHKEEDWTGSNQILGINFYFQDISFSFTAIDIFKNTGHLPNVTT